MITKKAKILDIVKGTTVDGPGFRTSIYFAGCEHKCEGCHNPQSWDFHGGHDMSVEELMKIIEEEEFDVTLTGGDPLYQIDFITQLAPEIRKIGLGIWLYTGFKWEEIFKSDTFSLILPYIDVIVDSPFILSERDTDLLFRGSSNQRIIDVRKSVINGKLTEWTR